MDNLSLTAEIFKNSQYFQNHVKNESSIQRKNCKFCQEIIPSFVELYLNREKQLGKTIYVDAKKTDEMILQWIGKYNQWENSQ